MKKTLFSILSVLLMATLLTSPVSAAPGIKFSGGSDSVEWALGSLVARGALIIGNTDVVVHLAASGQSVVTCTAQGSNPVPAQNPPFIGAQAQQERTKNGISPFEVTASPVETLPGSQGGCPDDNWTAHIDFVSWDFAAIVVADLADGSLLLYQEYTCTTTRNPDAVTCTPN